MSTSLNKNRNVSFWEQICGWITLTENRLYIGWFGCLLFPTLLTAISVFLLAFVAAPPVDIDGIRESVSGSLFSETTLFQVLWFLAQTQLVSFLSNLGVIFYRRMALQRWSLPVNLPALFHRSLCLYTA